MAMTEEQKAKMKAGREAAKAQRAAMANINSLVADNTKARLAEAADVVVPMGFSAKPPPPSAAQALAEQRRQEAAREKLLPKEPPPTEDPPPGVQVMLLCGHVYLPEEPMAENWAASGTTKRYDGETAGRRTRLKVHPALAEFLQGRKQAEIL